MQRVRWVQPFVAKTNCLRLMDEVQETGTVIVVTKHRRSVARVSPFREERPKLVGSCKGQLRIIASEPAIPADDWDMLTPGPIRDQGV